MDEADQNCRICKKPKKKSGGGFVTSFIDVCQCEFMQDAPDDTIAFICANCKLKIKSNQKGSITQWIFKPGYCSCESPSPIVDEDSSSTQKSFAGYEDNIEEEYLNLDSEKFPTDRYQPIKELGRGSGGSVYLARDQLLGIKVAVKILHELKEELLVSFQSEAKSTSRLNHPNIVKVLDFGITDSESPYMVLEYFEGISLDRFLKQNGPLDEKASCHLFAEIANGLNHAHSKGIYHRDIKPSNILISEIPSEMYKVKIIDFGIAKIKQATSQPVEFQKKTLAGTPGYMSPDQLSGYDYDERSEVYSLACVLFEVLTGEAPFKADSALEIVSRQVNDPPPELDASEFSPSIRTLIKDCLSLEPDNRPSMKELSKQLSAIQDESMAGTDKEPGFSETQKNRSRIASITVVSLLLAVSAIILLFTNNQTAFLSKPEKKPVYEKVFDDQIKAQAENLNDISSEINELSLKEGQFLVLHPRFPGYKTYRVYSTSKTKMPDWSELERQNKKIDLVLEVPAVSAQDLDTILKLKNLKVLSVALDHGITVDDFKKITTKKDLEGLTIVNSPVIGPSDLTLLQSLKKLTMLEFDNCNITAAKAREIAKLKSVAFLAITNDKQVDSKSINHICKSMNQITAFNLRNSVITDESFTGLSRLNHLKSLSVNGATSVTDKALNTLVANKSPIDFLDLNSTSITRKGLMKLNNLPNLKQVRLGGNPNFNLQELLLLSKTLKYGTTVYEQGTVKALDKMFR